MAQIHEENLVCKISSLARDDEQAQSAITPEIMDNVREVLEQLIPGTIVEIINVGE